MATTIDLRPVTADNWRDCVALAVEPPPSRSSSRRSRSYLCLCHYGRVWHPLAVYAGDSVVGFAMWAMDPDDGSGWIGGLLIDRRRQRRGYGRARWGARRGSSSASTAATGVALSSSPRNAAARALYESLGFVETGEMEDDEVVVRRRHFARLNARFRAGPRFRVYSLLAAHVAQLDQSVGLRNRRPQVRVLPCAPSISPAKRHFQPLACSASPVRRGPESTRSALASRTARRIAGRSACCYRVRCQSASSRASSSSAALPDIPGGLQMPCSTRSSGAAAAPPRQNPSQPGA